MPPVNPRCGRAGCLSCDACNPQPSILAEIRRFRAAHPILWWWQGHGPDLSFCAGAAAAILLYIGILAHLWPLGAPPPALPVEPPPALPAEVESYDRYHEQVGPEEADRAFVEEQERLDRLARQREQEERERQHREEERRAQEEQRRRVEAEEARERERAEARERERQREADRQRQAEERQRQEAGRERQAAGGRR